VRAGVQTGHDFFYYRYLLPLNTEFRPEVSSSDER